MKILFWSSLIFIFYTYLGYPLLLWILSRFHTKAVAKRPITPTVSVVISALNEERNIQARLENLFSQDYPLEKMEIIVVSDGSTDSTAYIVAGFAQRNVLLIELPERNGKAFALNQGIAAAKGEIVVFTDARQIFEPDAIRQLVANFADRGVGCVSGELNFVLDAASGIQAEMGAYWRYEKWIRKNESRTGSVIGATGAIYAIRRSLYHPLPLGTLLDDVLTPLNVFMQGYRCAFDGSAVAYDSVSTDASQEWTRKVRTLAGNWQLLSLKPKLAFSIKNQLCWRFMSHKIFRLLVPFALIAMVVSGFVLEERVYLIANTAQALFYLLCVSGILLPATRKLRLINIVYFFVVMNGAALMGLWQWLTGRCESTWNTTRVKA